MQQLTEQEAIKFAESRVWETWTDEQIVRLQLFQQLICVDLDRFHAAMNNVLGRPFYLHEISVSNKENLILEYLGEKPAPDIDEIIELIPIDKRILIK